MSRALRGKARATRATQRPTVRRTKMIPRKRLWATNKKALQGVMVFLIFQMGNPASGYFRTLFKKSSINAHVIVLAESLGPEGNWEIFEIKEIIRGKPQDKEIRIPGELWDLRGPNLTRNEIEKYQFLFLLGDNNILLCGHIGSKKGEKSHLDSYGLFLISDGCVGILPLINGKLTKEFRKIFYDGSDAAELTFTEIREYLKKVPEDFKMGNGV